MPTLATVALLRRWGTPFCGKFRCGHSPEPDVSRAARDTSGCYCTTRVAVVVRVSGWPKKEPLAVTVKVDEPEGVPGADAGEDLPELQPVTKRLSVQISVIPRSGYKMRRRRAQQIANNGSRANAL